MVSPQAHDLFCSRFESYPCYVYKHPHLAPIVQLVEHQPSKLVVEGSSPSGCYNGRAMHL